MIPRAWADRWLSWRNALIASPKFQRWAASFPLTRPVAHASAQRLFNVVSGFVHSQVLVACVRLGVPELLAKGPMTTDEIAAATDLPLSSAARLMAAGEALGLFDPAGPGRHALGLLGAALRGNGGLDEMIRHHALFYEDLADPVALLRGGGGKGALSGFWPYAAHDRPDAAGAEAVSPYSRLMAATQPMVADDVLHACPLGGVRALLDVGGGEGAFALAAAASAPDLRVAVFDLPAVATRARARFAEAGMGARATAHGGDFLRDPLPEGFDAISFVRILHDHDDATVMHLLRAARAAIAPGGMVIVAEPMSAAPARDPMAEAYFGFYLLAMGRGRARRPAELMAMARAAGFGRVRMARTRTPLLVRVLVARA
jgi:demethylspheroidene O-methyltransferase